MGSEFQEKVKTAFNWREQRHAVRVSCYFNVDPHVVQQPRKKSHLFQGVGFLFVTLFRVRMCAVGWNGGMKPELCSPRLWNLCRVELQQHSPKNSKLPKLLRVFEEVACVHLLSLWTSYLKRANTCNEATLNRLGALQARGRAQGRWSSLGPWAARTREDGVGGKALGTQERDFFWKDAQTFFLHLSPFVALLEPVALWQIPDAWAEAAVWAGEEDPELEVGEARNKEADKAGFGLVNGEKSVHRWMGIKGFTIEEDKERLISVTLQKEWDNLMKDRVWRERMGRRPKTLQDMKYNVPIFRQKNKRKINYLSTWLLSPVLQNLKLFHSYRGGWGAVWGWGLDYRILSVVKMERKDVVVP